MSVSNNNTATSGSVFDHSHVVVNPAAYKEQGGPAAGMSEGSVECVSALAEGAVPFGSIVVGGTTDNQVKVPTAGAGAAGVKALGVAFPSANVGGTAADGCNVNVAVKGRVYLKHGEATSLTIAKGGLVYSTYDGKLKASANNAYYIVGVAASSISSSTNADDLVLVELNAGAVNVTVSND